MVDGSVLVVYQGAFLRRSAICLSGLALVVYHRTMMVCAMNVKGTLRWTAFSTRFLGFADTGDVFRVVEADFDRPPGRVAGDDLGGGRGHVRGDDRDVVAFVGSGFTVPTAVSASVPAAASSMPG